MKVVFKLFCERQVIWAPSHSVCSCQAILQRFGCENFGTVGEDPITAAQQGRRVFCFQLLCLRWFHYSTWNSGKQIKVFGVCHPERWSSGNPLREDSWGGGSVLWQEGELPPWNSAELVIIGCSKATAFAFVVIASRTVTFTVVKVLSPSTGYLNVCSKYNCTSLQKRNPLQADKYENTMSSMSEVLDVHVGGSWGNVEGNLCLLHSHMLFQVSTFSVAEGETLGLRDLRTFLWSESFLIFWHIIPWSCGCGFLTGGQELRNKIH